MEDRAYRAIRVESKGHVARITLSVPERKNALNPDMVNELIWALDDARDDAGVRAIILTGDGGVFCAGGDLKRMGGAGDDDAPPLAHRGDFADLLLRFPGLGKPTIARVLGVAMGGGLGLLGCCDFAIAAESTVLGTPEIRRGLFPMTIMAVLQHLVPRRQLMRMMLLGDKMTATEALAAGLLTEVVADDALDGAVDALATRLAAQSPTAMRMGLRAFHAQVGVPLEESVPRLRDALVELLGTEDAQEGLRAFFEKREPRWK